MSPRLAKAAQGMLCWLLAAVPAAAAIADDVEAPDDFDEITLYDSVSVGFGMLLLGSDAEAPGGLSGHVVARATNASRFIVDRATGATFGYHLEVAPLSGVATSMLAVRMDIRPLSASEAKELSRLTVCEGCPRPRLVEGGPVRFPPTRIVREGDTVVVDMLVRPSTGETIVDVLKFSRDAVTREEMEGSRSRVREAARHVKQGDERMARGELDAAAAAYVRALELRPDAAAHVRLARCEVRRGRTGAAQRHYELALAGHAGDAETWHELAVLQHRAGQIGKASNAYRQALKLRPDAALARRNLASAHLDRGAIAEAYEEYRQAYRSDATVLASRDPACVKPGDTARQLYLFAKVYAAEGDWDAAVRSLERARDAGFTDFGRVKQDPEFKPLLMDPRLVALVARGSRS